MENYSRLEMFFYVTDGYGIYPQFIEEIFHLVSKPYMTRVEGENRRLRHYLARLYRKILCYSKSVKMFNIFIRLLLSLKRRNLLEKSSGLTLQPVIKQYIRNLAQLWKNLSLCDESLRFATRMRSPLQFPLTSATSGLMTISLGSVEVRLLGWLILI